MALALADLFKKAQPEELIAVREALASAKDAAPGREVLPEDERRTLAAELTRRAAASEAAFAKRQARRAELERGLEAAQRELDSLHETSTSEDEFRAWQPGAAARLWEGRLPLVDELAARCHKEADDLWPPASVTLEPDFPSREGRLTFSNEPAVRARQFALRALADLVESWTRRACYVTETELRALFAKAYEALPRVESIQAILEAHPRGRTYLRRLNIRTAPTLPPAA